MQTKALSRRRRNLLPRRRFGLLALLALAIPGAARAVEPALPFSIAVTEEKLAKLPDYMGPGNSIDMDFPYCPVMIDGEYWIIYKNGYNAPVLRYRGTNIENGARQPDGSAALPNGAYILGGLWYNAGEKKLYAPLHYEVARYGNYVRREIHLATSIDKGLTWKYEGPLLTSDPWPGERRSPTEYSGLCWDGGDGDHMIYVDVRGGYIYLFTNHYTWPKIGSPARAMHRHRVARCAIADKMASGKWRKFHNGAWSEPGIGGKASWVSGYDVIYNAYLKKYVSIDCPGALCACDDLMTQRWTPAYHLGPYWGSNYDFGFWATNDLKNDTQTAGRTMNVYNFWQKSPGRRFRVEFGPGQTPPAAGFISPSSLLDPTEYYWGADPANLYTFGAQFESADSIDARRTRRFGCTSAELKYAGPWSDVADPACYEGHAKTASAEGATLDFTFRGTDIFWRAEKGPPMGKADVFLDGVGQATVDCWGSLSNRLQFAFVKQGLSDREHKIRIVVRGDKNRLASGTAVKHLSFEVSADTYRASDCFSSSQGKNQWHYQEIDGTNSVDMTFHDPIWMGKRGGQIGFFQMTPGAGGVSRAWVAPHDGSVRIEGDPTLTGTNDAGIVVAVQANKHELWSAKLTTPNKATASCQATAVVQAGDALTFVAKNANATEPLAPGLGVPEKKDAVQVNRRFGKPPKIGAMEFVRGLACAAGTKVFVHLSEPGKTLSAMLGVDANKDPGAKSPSHFSITIGGKKIYASAALKGHQQQLPIDVDLDGATEFMLEADGELDLANAKIVQVNGQEIWLDTLPLEQRQSATPRVLWDPVITYLK
jgi:hypothetical protein